MAFWQLNFEVYHLHPDPDNPHQELVPPPVFRPATLLFPDQTIRKKSMNSDDEALCASQGKQACTAFASNETQQSRLELT